MVTQVVNKIEIELKQTFDELFKWFNIDNELLHYAPDNTGWSIRKILEHVSLTNHYLLMLIRKGTKKALERSKKQEFSGMLAGYDLDWERLKPIGQHRSFAWSRPGHTEPRGRMPVAKIRYELEQQLKQCCMLLSTLQHGEGVLHKTMMSVNNLGKIDVYHYIYFVVQHAKRHITQMEAVEIEFNLGVS
ncbi:DinB family protein [Longitalea arenae]|uniref:DinB family protein n=1 Tax=Longitalea arenae TaxID=2812558 RepID=UPI0019683ACB|nr:DinB family protein [Longitalea arenae]